VSRVDRPTDCIASGKARAYYTLPGDVRIVFYYGQVSQQRRSIERAVPCAETTVIHDDMFTGNSLNGSCGIRYDSRQTRDAGAGRRLHSRSISYALDARHGSSSFSSIADARAVCPTVPRLIRPRPASHRRRSTSIRSLRRSLSGRRRPTTAAIANDRPSIMAQYHVIAVARRLMNSFIMWTTTDRQTAAVGQASSLLWLARILSRTDSISAAPLQHLHY